MTETISNTRRDLTTHVARFREQGMDAEPVVFGDHRRAEAVLLPHATFEMLLELAEDSLLAERVRARLAVDNGNRTSLAEVADLFEVDLNSL